MAKKHFREEQIVSLLKMQAVKQMKKLSEVAIERLTITVEK